MCDKMLDVFKGRDQNGMKRWLMGAGLLLGLCGIAHAQAAAAVASGPNGVAITQSDLQVDAQRIPEQSRLVVLSKPDNVQRMATGLYVRRALAHQAKQAGLDKDPVLQADIQQAVDRVLSEAFLKHVADKDSPGDAELEKYALARYQADATGFDVPEQTRVRHILVAKNENDAIKKADDLLKQLKAGADFETLAKEHSADYASAQRGGDLGFFGAGRMVAPFDAAVKALREPGQLSPIVETQFGYHIIRFEARRPAQRVPFEEVKERLKQEAAATLRNERRQQAGNIVRDTVVVNESAVKAFAAQYEKALKQPSN